MKRNICRIAVFSVLAALLLLCVGALKVQQAMPSKAELSINIIPQPASLQQKEGDYVLDQNTARQFVAGDKELQGLGNYLEGRISRILTPGSSEASVSMPFISPAKHTKQKGNNTPWFWC